MSNNSRTRNWNDRYDTSDYVFGTEPNDFLKSVSGEIARNSDVLCLADGEGRNGVYLAELGHKVTSVDASSLGLQKANKLASDRGVSITTVEADLSEWDLGETCWDCIVSIFFHIPPELQAVIYPRIIRALKPGGLLILESYTPDQLKFGTGGPPSAELMLTADMVQRHFDTLELVHCEALEREVIEGIGHTGMAAVLQVIGKKSA